MSEIVPASPNEKSPEVPLSLPKPLSSIEHDVDALRAKIPIPKQPPAIKGACATPPLPEGMSKLIKEDKALQQLLLDTYNPKLPKAEGPSSSHPETVIVWRGCRADQLVKIARTSTAGGAALNADIPPPSEKEARSQVGESASIPEFTFASQVAERFGRGNFVIACEIHVKYLAKGSSSEQGVVCSPQAPVKILGWKHGPRLGGRL